MAAPDAIVLIETETGKNATHEVALQFIDELTGDPVYRLVEIEPEIPYMDRRVREMYGHPES